MVIVYAWKYDRSHLVADTSARASFSMSGFCASTLLVISNGSRLGVVALLLLI